MNPPKPYNEEAGENPSMPDPDDIGMQNFAQNTDFLQKLHNPHFPHKGAGTHVPMWVTPELAKELMLRHGKSGHAIPHPNIDLKDLSK
jgi:hypothetical protein